MEIDKIPAQGRTVSFDFVLDPSCFSSLQLQPRMLGSISINAFTRWLREFSVGPERMMTQFRTSCVLYGIHLQYLEPLRCGMAESVLVTCGTRVRQNGAQLETTSDLTAGGKRVVRAQTIWVTLWLEDSDELAAVPATLPSELLAHYRPDELDPTPYQPPVLPLVETAASGRLLAEGEEHFTLHRHHCEIDDKWWSIEALGFCGAVRELMVLKHGREKPELRKGLSLPLRSADVLLTRPIYLFDRFRVQTRAHAVEERIMFIHRLVTADGDAVHATVVEQF